MLLSCSKDHEKKDVQGGHSMGDSARAKSSSKLDQRLWPITGLSGGLLLLPVGAEGASIALALISEATCCARLLERRAERPVRTTERGESKRGSFPTRGGDSSVMEGGGGGGIGGCTLLGSSATKWLLLLELLLLPELVVG